MPWLIDMSRKEINNYFNKGLKKVKIIF